MKICNIQIILDRPINEPKKEKLVRARDKVVSMKGLMTTMENMSK